MSGAIRDFAYRFSEGQLPRWPQASLGAGVAALVLPPRALAAALQAAFAMPGVREWFRVHEGSAYLATAV